MWLAETYLQKPLFLLIKAYYFWTVYAPVSVAYIQTTAISYISVLESVTKVGTEKKIKGQFLCLWGCGFWLVDRR